MGDWEESAKKAKTDDLVLNAAELADIKLTVGNSDDDIDKILFEVSCQFESVSPPIAKRSKMDSKVSSKFPAIATYSPIQQTRQNAIAVKGKTNYMYMVNE